jgi:hypothetical protein
MTSDQEFLTAAEVLNKIKTAASSQKPFSIVRIGDGENIVLAQDSVWTIDQVLAEKWAQKANAGKKGVTLPNLLLRDQIVEAIRQADIVGIPFVKKDPIRTARRLKRALTDEIFQYYRIRPKAICHTFVTRVLPQKKEFWEALRDRRILIITKQADQLRDLLQAEPYNLKVTLTIPFVHYDELPETLDIIQANKDHFDAALISCGVNAVVLAAKVAELAGKIGLDFGKSAAYMVKGKAGLDKSSSRANLDLIP